MSASEERQIRWWAAMFRSAQQMERRDGLARVRFNLQNIFEFQAWAQGLGLWTALHESDPEIKAIFAEIKEVFK